MSAPTKRAPVKKAAVKRSPRAAKPAPVEPELTDADLQALTDDQPDELAPGEIRPVVIGKRGRRGDVPVEMVAIFELNDVPYEIPRNPSAALVLRWMLDTREHGSQVAAETMALTLLGRDALDALAASPEVEPEDVRDIFDNLGAVFFTSDNYRKILAAPDPS